MNRLFLLWPVALLSLVAISAPNFLTQPHEGSAFAGEKILPHNLILGDRINVMLAGELSRKYVGLIGLDPPAEDFGVPLICTVERTVGEDRLELKGERIDVNHTGKQFNENDKMRMMTFIANIQIKDLRDPQGFFDPADPETHSRKSEIAKMPTIRLTSTKGVEIRSWALVHEIGE